MDTASMGLRFDEWTTTMEDMGDVKAAGHENYQALTLNCLRWVKNEKSMPGTRQAHPDPRHSLCAALLPFPDQTGNP